MNEKKNTKLGDLSTNVLQKGKNANISNNQPMINNIAAENQTIETPNKNHLQNPITEELTSDSHSQISSQISNSQSQTFSPIPKQYSNSQLLTSSIYPTENPNKKAELKCIANLKKRKKNKKKKKNDVKILPKKAACITQSSIVPTINPQISKEVKDKFFSDIVSGINEKLGELVENKENVGENQTLLLENIRKISEETKVNQFNSERKKLSKQIRQLKKATALLKGVYSNRKVFTNVGTQTIQLEKHNMEVQTSKLLYTQVTNESEHFTSRSLTLIDTIPTDEPVFLSNPIENRKSGKFVNGENVGDYDDNCNDIENIDFFQSDINFCNSEDGKGTLK